MEVTVPTVANFRLITGGKELKTGTKRRTENAFFFTCFISIVDRYRIQLCQLYTQVGFCRLALQNCQAFFLARQFRAFWQGQHFQIQKAVFFQPFRAQIYHKSAKIFPGSAKIFPILSSNWKSNYFWLDLSKHKKIHHREFFSFF